MREGLITSMDCPLRGGVRVHQGGRAAANGASGRTRPQKKKKDFAGFLHEIREGDECLGEKALSRVEQASQRSAPPTCRGSPLALGW